MTPNYQDLFLAQGSSFNKTLTLIDNAGLPYNLTIYNTVASQARRSFQASNTIINFTCNILDASNGIIQLTANANTTSNVTNRKLVYDVLISNTSTGEIIRTSEGQIIIDPSVTR